MTPYRLYFAYGSNMDELQMHERCPHAVQVDVAFLQGHKFIINRRGVASIVAEDSSNVYGTLWRISGTDERTLDMYEGVPNHYTKQTMRVSMAQGTPQTALVYVATDEKLGYARNGYLETIVSAATEHGLPESYIEELKQWFKTDVLRS